MSNKEQRKLQQLFAAISEAKTPARKPESKPSRQAKPQPYRLGDHLKKRGVGGSRRRGRNASNEWFADRLMLNGAAIPPKLIKAIAPMPVHPKRTRCMTCGKSLKECKARFPERQTIYVG